MGNASRASTRKARTCPHGRSGMNRNGNRSDPRRATSACRIMTPATWSGSKRSASGRCRRVGSDDGRRESSGSTGSALPASSKQIPSESPTLAWLCDLPPDISGLQPSCSFARMRRRSQRSALPRLCPVVATASATRALRPCRELGAQIRWRSHVRAPRGGASGKPDAWRRILL